ncbi:MAG: glycosyltransferase family 2 protein [Candidatus Yanofskybacteria bacterium]|nr:glycosyltransferase family 2 protein [Candidatus Yanofskybacteria bacterium]
MNGQLKEVYLSVILPIYNEEKSLPELMRELYSVCNSLNKEYEIIFVNDCSTDKTYDMLRQYAEKDRRIKVIRFSRNFGHQAALSAGIDASSGELVVTMDSDLQHPPELIKEFVKQAEAGHDIVIGERMANKQNSFLREMVGRAIYKFLSVTTGLEFKNAGDFVLYKRRVVDVIKKLPEREKFFRGLAQWVGFKKKYVPYAVRFRKFGRGTSIRGLAKFILNGVTSFSAFPLRISFWIGLVIFLGSVGYGVSVVIEKFLYPENLIEGLSSLTIVVLILGSVQLMVIGIIGEYLYKMFNEIKGRPVYIIAETKNLENDRKF